MGGRPSSVRVTGPLAAYAESFRRELEGQGYKQHAVVNHLRLPAHLSRWLVEHKINLTNVDDAVIDPFLAATLAPGLHAVAVCERDGPLVQGAFFEADWWEVFNHIVEPPDERVVAEARQRIDGLGPVGACLPERGGVPHRGLREQCPPRPRIWRCCRYTNLLESIFGETRRRTKVIGRLPAERTSVALVFAVLDRQSRSWRGMTMTPVRSGVSRILAPAPRP